MSTYQYIHMNLCCERGKSNILGVTKTSHFLLLALCRTYSIVRNLFVTFDFARLNFNAFVEQ